MQQCRTSRTVREAVPFFKQLTPSNVVLAALKQSLAESAEVQVITIHVVLRHPAAGELHAAAAAPAEAPGATAPGTTSSPRITSIKLRLRVARRIIVTLHWLGCRTGCLGKVARDSCDVLHAEMQWNLKSVTSGLLCPYRRKGKEARRLEGLLLRHLLTGFLWTWLLCWAPSE